MYYKHTLVNKSDNSPRCGACCCWQSAPGSLLLTNYCWLQISFERSESELGLISSKMKECLYLYFHSLCFWDGQKSLGGWPTHKSPHHCIHLLTTISVWVQAADLFFRVMFEEWPCSQANSNFLKINHNLYFPVILF